LVDVIRQRPLSREIAARLGIPHESPQVIVIRGGTVRWHASHYEVTADALAAQIRVA
jgi:bacillithiol system protein YtxJ